MKKETRQKLIMGMGVFIIVTIIFSLILSRKLPKNQYLTPSVPKTTPVSTPQELPHELLAIELSSDPTVLNLVDTNPRSSTITSVWSVEPVVLYFDDDIDLKTVLVSSNPDARVRTEYFSNDSKALSIYPLDGWDSGTTYTVTVSKSLKSKSGKSLPKELHFTFKRVTPEPGDPEYPQPIPNEE